MKKPALTLSVAAAIALAGCGSDDSNEVSGPASAIPADMAFYVEATIRPEGEQAENLDALVSEFAELPLLGNVGDPRDFAIERLEEEASTAGIEFSYDEDIEPWLGEKAGFGATEGTDGETRFVVAVETTDENKARESIESLLAQGNPTEEGEYEGVSYLTLPDDSVRLGVFDGHVVFAPASDFEAAVDASSGDSLGSSDKFAESFDTFEDDRLASFYFDFARYQEFVTDPEDAEELETAQAILPEIFEGTFSIAAGTTADDQVYVDYSVQTFEGQPEAGASALLGTPPADSIGAFAIEDIGEFGPPIVELFERAQEEGADLEDFPEEGIEQAFEDETGIAFDDAAEAIGDASVYVRGDLPDDLEVGGEIEAADAEVAGELIDAIQKEIESEGNAKLGPPVGGSDVGFSAIERESDVFEIDVPSGEQGRSLELSPDEVKSVPECTSIGDAAECIPTGGAAADLPFANIELDGDVIRYGFFRDEAAAEASDADSAGDFADSDAYAAGQEAIGEDFEYLGAVDLQPILDEFVPTPGIDDAILGGSSPEALIAPFLADKLGVVAFGQRYEDDVAVTRYLLELAE